MLTLPVLSRLYYLTFRKPVQKLDFGAAEIVIGDDALSCQSLDTKHKTYSSKKRHLMLLIGIKLMVCFILSPGVALKAPLGKQADVAMDLPMCRDFYGFKCVLTDMKKTIASLKLLLVYLTGSFFTVFRQHQQMDLPDS